MVYLSAAQMGEAWFCAEAEGRNHLIVVIVEQNVADGHDSCLILVGLVRAEVVQRGGVGWSAVGTRKIDCH